VALATRTYLTSFPLIPRARIAVTTSETAMTTSVDRAALNSIRAARVIAGGGREASGAGCIADKTDEDTLY
jgi:hypothetical protein